MSSTKKALIGIFTFLPLFLLIWFFYIIFSLVAGKLGDFESASHMKYSNPDEMMEMMKVIFFPLTLIVITTFGILIYYLIDIFSLNPKFQPDTGNNRLIWTLVVFFGGFIGMIVYFFVEIVPRNEELYYSEEEEYE